MSDLKDLGKHAPEAVIMKLAAKRGDTSRGAIRESIKVKQGIEISRQKFDQWCDEVASFPNDMGQILTETYDLAPEEQVELALALSFGQRTRLLRKQE